MQALQAQVEPVQRKFVCSTLATLQVRSLDVLAEQLAQSSDPVVNAQKCQLPTSGSAVRNSDMFRFLVLYFYGGLYVDADTLFLKDLAVFHGLSFAFKWGGGGEDNPVAQGFNTAIMGLPKGSPIPGRIIQKHGCSPTAFYPSSVNSALDCANRDTECIGFAMMPTMLFDPIHATSGTEKWRDPGRYFSNGDSIFSKPSPFVDGANFYPGAFAYHWHNRWNMPYHEKSEFARLVELNSRCDSPDGTTGSAQHSTVMTENDNDEERRTPATANVDGPGGKKRQRDHGICNIRSYS